MRIREMFEKKIDRDIKGVIKLAKMMTPMSIRN